MLLRLSKRFFKLALIAPLLVAPFIIKEGFVFPISSFFPFIAMKAIYFRVIVELSLFFLVMHLLFSTTRELQFRSIIARLKKPLPLAIISFGLIFFITALLGENPAMSVWSNFERGEGAFQILHYCLFFILGFTLFTRKEEIRKLIRFNLWVSLFVCLYAFTQLFEVQTIFGTIGSSDRISGTLGNPSYLAGYLLINFAFIAYEYLQANTRKARGWLLALLGIELLAFANTGTRGAYLGLIIGLAIVYLTTLITTQNRQLRTRLILIAVGLTSAGIALVGAYYSFPSLQGSPLLSRLFDVQGAVSGFGPRIWTWESALKGAAERPLLGWGAENFPYSFDKHYNPKHFGIESFFDRTHNVFLEYLISGGIVLLLAYLAIWYAYYRTLKSREKNLWNSILIATPIAYLVQAFFLFDVLSIYLILFLFLAVTSNLREHEHTTHLSDDGYGLGHTELLTASGLFALTLFIIISTAVIPWKKNLLIANIYSLPGADAQVVFTKFQEAIAYNSPVGQEEAVSGMFKFSIDILETALRQKSEVPAQTVRIIVDTNNALFDEYQKEMSGLRNWYLIGGLNFRSGLSFGFPEYAKRGEEIYRAALEIAPTRIEFIKILIEVSQATGNTEAYEKYLKQAQELRPDINWTVPPALPSLL